MRKSIFKNWDRHQKKWYGQWHLYLGIIAGAVIAIIGLTGSILVFRDEIDAALNPSLFRALSQEKRLGIGEAYTLFHEQHPDVKVNYLYQPADFPTSTYVFYNYVTAQQIFVNPYNGQICGKRLYESGFINLVTDIHTSLLIPGFGQYVTGTAALILLILTISGMRLWIPKKWKQLKSVLSVNFRSNWRRQNYDWHNVLGFYSAPVVVLLALTGFCITFYLPMVALLFTLNGKNPKEVMSIYSLKSTYQKGASPLPLSKVIAAGSAVFPEGKARGLALPADSSGSYRIDYVCPGKSRDGRREMVVVDQYSGKVLAASKSFPNVAQAVLSWMQPLHYGTFGGLQTRILVLIGGLVPAALFVTGFIIWWPRWKKQRHKPAKIRAPGPRVYFPERKSRYFGFNFKLGSKYALLLLVAVAACGGLYGMLSGRILPPAAFAVIFVGVLVIINFLVACAALLFNIVFLGIPRKGFRPMWRYFALSLGFFLVFGTVCVLLINSGWKIF